MLPIPVQPATTPVAPAVIERVDRVFPMDTAHRVADQVSRDRTDLLVINTARAIVASVASEQDGLGWRTVAPKSRQDAILQWVREHVNYVPDPHKVEVVRSPRLLLQEVFDSPTQQTSEDCESIAGLIAALQLAVDIPSRIQLVSLSPDEPGDWSHVMARGRIAGFGWITVDACTDNDEAALTRQRVNDSYDAEIP